MSAAPAGQAPAPDAHRRTLLDRALLAFPVALAILALLTLYGIEAWLRKTPWVFTDEVEWTQISRSIAETGHAARRGEPVSFKSLYAILIAPCWWIHSTATAYAAIKYLNAIVMTLAAVPTYLLARMLVTRRTAFVVAVLSVLIPAMSYASSLVYEIAAYPWYALSSWLIVRALARRRPLDIALASAVSVGAVLVRSPRFFTVVASFVIAAGWLWFTGPRGRALRAGWSRGDKIGAAVLFAGALMLFNRVVLQHDTIWQLSTQYYKDRMVDLGLQAGLAFAIGIGILPLVGGLASLHLPERRDEPVYRAFAAYLGAAIFCNGLYTAVKVAYLSTVFSTLTEERNLIYLSPLLFLGTALTLQAARLDRRVVALATLFAGYLIVAKPLQLQFPYFEAPGMSILAIPNKSWGWTTGDLRVLLLGMLVLSVLALVFRRRAAVVAAVVVLGGAWMLTSELKMTAGMVHFGNQFRAALPVTLDWIDRDVHGQPVTYLGQAIKDPNILLATEFWNRSLAHVDSLDGSAPGPGPTYVPDVTTAQGTLSGLADAPYVLADRGVTLQADVVDRWSTLTLYRRTGPWRLLDAVQQVYSDSWAPGWSTYSYFRTGQSGTLQVSLGRQGYIGTAPPGTAVIRVGTVKIVAGQAQLGHVFAVRRISVENGSSHVLEIPVARTPVRVEITITPTFHASDTDPRDLGAQVGFAFRPANG